MANDIKVGITLEGKDALRTLALLDKGLKRVGTTGTKSIGSMNTAMKVFQGTLGANVALRSVDLLGRALKQGAKDALDFGQAIQEINSIVPRTAVETLALKNTLIQLSNQYGKSAQGQAKAFYNILSAGITDTVKATQLLDVANKVAVAGLVDVDSAGRGLISVLNSYTDGSLNATEASDILFTAIREGRTTMGELAGTIGRVASISASASVGFDEVAGALAFITKSGVQTDEAVIGLRQTFTALLDTNSEGARRAKELGVEFGEATLKAKGFRGVMNDLSKATGGSVEELRRIFPNVRAFTAVVKIAGGDLADFNRILDETANATGATDKALQVVSSSAGFQFEKLTNQLKNFPTAILTNFEEPLADSLKTINEFVGNQGLLLIPQAVEVIITSFQDLLNTKDDLTDFFDSIGELASNTVNAITGIENVSTESLTEKLGDLEGNLASLQETAKVTAERLASVSDQGGRGGDNNVALQQIEARSEAIKKQIELTKIQISAFQQADLEDAKASQAELKRREERNNRINEFREKLQASQEAFVANEKARKEQEVADDKANAEKKLNNAINAEVKKFKIIDGLKASRKELDLAEDEEDKLAKELANEEEFLFLEENLGRENALRELYRIQQITDEKKKVAELKKIQKKASKEEQAGILHIAKFEDQTNKQKVANQKATLGQIATLTASNNKVLFNIGKASALAGAYINTAQAVTVALKSAPPPFNFVLAGLVGTAGALQAGKIIAQKPPSAGSFANGGIIEGPSQTGDQLTANVNSGEAIFNRRQQQNLFNAVNNNSLGGGGNSIVINSSSLTGQIPQESIDDLIDQLNERTEYGNKQLRTA